MKHLFIIVSLVLFSFYPLKDNQKEQLYLAGTDGPVSLNCPDYLPTEYNINANPNFAKPDAGLNKIDQNWYSAAVDNILKEEYNISYSEELKSFQSPNRANNIRFTYQNNGFTAKTMQTKIPLFDMNDKMLREADKNYKTIEDWSVELQFKNYELVINNSKSFAAGNKAMLENEKIRIDYTNTKEGMRQDFIVKKKPAGDEDLQLIMNVSTKLNMNVTKDAVTFRSKKDSSDKMHYSSLKAWDVTGKILNSYFDKQNDRQFAIRVIDKDAQYPVTVDPLSSTPDWVKESNSENAAFGISVSTAGDVNGDGYDDVLIGADMFSGEYENQGKAYLFYGSSTGLNTDPAWTALGTSEKRYLGKKVSAAGDVNNDGYSDVLIVSGLDYYGEFPNGAVYAYYGSAIGLSSVPDWTRDFNISIYIVAEGAGDINGDGYDDILYSRPRIGPHGEGIAYLHYASSSGLEINPAWSYLNTCVGRGLSSAGDVNGDGYDDIIISAYWDPLLMGYADKSILFLGSAEGFSQSPDWSKSNCYGESGSGGGDINGDGYDDLIIGDGRCSPGNVYIHFGSVIGISNDPGWTIYGSDPAARFGSSVSNAGDINADGFSDIIIGAPNDNDTGKVFIYFGSASGPSDSTRLVFSCDQPLAKFGISVSSAGDVNNDGSSDVIFSAPGYSNGESGEGKVFVHYGNADLTPPLITNLSPHQNAVSVNKSSDINIVFNQNMNASTLNSSNIIVNGMYSGVIPASITYDAMLRTLTIDPVIDFKTGEKVFVLLKSGIMSENNASLTPFNFSFITSATGGSGMFQISDTIGSAGDVESGDIDSDGDIDIITGQQEIKIYKNDGAGHFSYFSQIPGGTVSFILKDFDLNGSLDIAYGAEGYLIKVFLNDGTGIFHQSSVSSGYIGKAGDFDGDGDPDMALLSGFDMIIARNDNGYFTMTDTIPVIHNCQEQGYPQAEYDIADMDNDGDLDIAEIHHTSLELLEMFFGCGYVELFRNDGAGNFSKETISSGRIGGNHNILEQCNITLFNYDGDDDADILLYYSKLTNTGNSEFVTSGSVWFLGKPFTADFNGDGNLDFVTSPYGEFYKNDGLGSFIRGENFSSWYISKISPADFDNDGDADLAGIKDNTLILYMNIDSVTTECITGPINTEVNSTNLYFTGSMLNVSFGLINFDSTEASIVSNINNDSVYINSGSKRGQFRINLSANGGIICSKNVFVDYPLPVKLAEFTSVINGRNVTLNWSTVSELNNSGFDIEKSIVKGQTSEGWSKIGFISGSGTISEPANYTFTDKDLLTGKYNYRLKQIDFNGNFEYFELAEEVSIGIPDKYELSQNYPNPFNPVTNLEYGIAKLGFVSLKIYDVLGKEVITLVNEIKEPGYYKIKFDAGKLSSGVYFYRMTAGNFVAVKKFVVMK